MIYLAAVLVVVGFALALQLLGVFAVATRAIATSRAAAAVMRNAAQSDIEKERATQKASVELLVGFISILIRAAAAIGISLLPLLALQALGLVGWSAVIQLLVTWQGIVLATGAMLLVYLFRKQR